MENRNLYARIRARRYASTFLVLITLAVGILIGTLISKGIKAKTIDSSDAAVLTMQNGTPQQMSNSFAAIAKKMEDSVVNINTETNPKPEANPRRRRGSGGNGDNDDQGDFQDFFNRFFGGGNGGGQIPFGQMPNQRERALGSGVILDANGYIITNNHVVDKADRIRVKLHGDPPGVLYDAKVVGVDTETDLAVIKIDPKGRKLVPAKLGNSDQAQVGDWVLAIGSPFGLENTVTAGIISYKGRSSIPGDTQHQFQQFIQTDAAINPGNSGGPLVDMNGNVIGINTAILTESMGYMGVGFAMPSSIVTNVYNQLIGTEHRVVRGSIGVTFNAEPNPAIARMYGKGVTVTQVTPGAPAEQAGIKVEDTITAVNGTPITNGDQLVNIISAMKPGEKAKIDYTRAGKPESTTVTIADRTKLFKADSEEEADNNDNNAPQTGKLGITVQAVTPDVAQRLSIPAGRGVIVSDVKPGSFADEDLGIQRGLVILDVNRHPVNSPQDFQNQVNALKTGQDIVMLVREPGKGGGTILLSGTLP